MSSDEQEIRALIAHWLTATHDAKVDEVLELIAPDALFLTAGQPPMQGHEAFADTLRHVLKDHDVQSSSEVEEVVVSGDMAYCRTTLTVTVTPRDGTAATTRQGPTLSILRKSSDGKWRLTRDANMLA